MTKSKGRFSRIEFQKGPISMNKQYSMCFPQEPERTRQDMQDIADRRAGMTLTLHEPKR